MGDHDVVPERWLEFAARLEAASKQLDGVAAATLEAVRVEIGYVAAQLRQLGSLPGGVVSRACQPNAILAVLDFVELAELLAGRRRSAGVELRHLKRAAQALALPLVVAPDGSIRASASDDLSSHGRERAWGDLAAAYEGDADRLFGVARRLRVEAGLAFAGVIVLGLSGLVHRVVRPDDDDALLYGYGALAFVLTLLAWMLFNTAARQSASAEEATRMARHAVLVPSYVALNRTGGVSALQVALAPRLFARALQDDDPVREPLWPTLADLNASAEAASENPPDWTWLPWRWRFRQPE